MTGRKVSTFLLGTLIWHRFLSRQLSETGAHRYLVALVTNDCTFRGTAENRVLAYNVLVRL